MKGRGSTKARLAGLCLLIAWATPTCLAAAEHWLDGIVDLRLLQSDSEEVWLDQGLDKARFGTRDEPAALGALLVEYRGRWSRILGAQVSVAAYDDVDKVIDVTEAFLELRPVPRSAWRFRLRAGAFYPPVSLENTATAWTSPYTLSFSALDTWIGEEIRTVGVELAATRLGRFTSSSHDFGVTAAVFQANDPAGALISWRGFALHDRQTGLFHRLPLADLPAFGPTGSFPPQEPFEKPFVEIDHRIGYYAGVQWDYLQRSRLRALHYDNLGDPAIVQAGQWSWRTRFDHLGWHLRLPGETELLVQGLLGDSLMVGFTGPLVNVEFWTAYVMASRTWGRQRASLRFDLFGVEDRDTIPDDPNQEHGRAWTAAYFFCASSTGRPGSWRLGMELLSVDSDRPARRLFGGPSRRREDSVTLVAQWRW